MRNTAEQRPAELGKPPHTHAECNHCSLNYPSLSTLVRHPLRVAAAPWFAIGAPPSCDGQGLIGQLTIDTATGAMCRSLVVKVRSLGNFPPVDSSTVDTFEPASPSTC